MTMFPVKGKFGKKYEAGIEFYITQEYGLTDFARSTQGKAYYKYFPNGIHPGYDFGTYGINLEAVATVDGEVVLAGPNGGWGNSVEVMGADGWRRQYAHLSMVSVKVGQKVKAGDTVGRIGTTGSSTAVHLHYGHRRWTSGKWEYRNPSVDFIVPPEAAKPLMPTSRFIKSTDPTNRAVYVFNGRMRFAIPDWQTFLILSGKAKDQAKEIEEVSPDSLTKIPEGPMATSFK